MGQSPDVLLLYMVIPCSDGDIATTNPKIVKPLELSPHDTIHDCQLCTLGLPCIAMVISEMLGHWQQIMKCLVSFTAAIV